MSSTDSLIGTAVNFATLGIVAAVTFGVAMKTAEMLSGTTQPQRPIKKTRKKQQPVRDPLMDLFKLNI